LRELVQHIEPGKREIVYTDFADELGEAAAHELPDVGAVDFARFKKKARHFLREHEDHIVLAKLRAAKPLTPTDLRELETMLLAAGVGEAAHLDKASEVSQGFGLFIRSLVGLDRPAVAEAFSEFLSDGAATANQIEFVEMVIDHLTEKGAMDPGLLYESPFIDIAPTGPQSVFPMERARKLISVIADLNGAAVVA
jgi:type I restriction enzyme R subunit